MNPNAAIINDLLFDKVSKWSQNPRFTLAYRDSILNEAQQLFVEICADLAQTNDRVEEDLRILREDNISLKSIDKDSISEWFEYPEKHFRTIRLGGKIKCPECPEKDLRKIIKAKGHEESNMLIDKNWEPSWDFATTFYSLVRRGIKVYHKSKFDITKFWIDYYKKPSDFRTASKTPNNQYKLADGNLIDYDQMSELAQNYQFRRITDIAAILCERNFDNNREWDLKIKNITLLENLYK